MELLIEKQEAARQCRRVTAGEDHPAIFPAKRRGPLLENVRIAFLISQAQERWAERPTPQNATDACLRTRSCPCLFPLSPCHHTHVPPIAAVPGKHWSDPVRIKRFEPPDAGVIESSGFERSSGFAVAQLPMSSEAGAL
jgi:hypothetical protein